MRQDEPSAQSRGASLSWHRAHIVGVLESLSFVVLTLAVLLVPLAMAAAIVEWLARRRRGSDGQRRS
jgi:hypothetical protein